MSNFGPTDEFDNRQQEEAEHIQWLDEYEKETVEECSRRMKQFEEDFKRLFGDQHE